MFGLEPVTVLLGVGVAALLEVALFWAAAALADAPERGWAKTFLVALVATAAWGAIDALVGWYAGLGPTSLAPENRPAALLVAAVALAVAWAVPAVLYVPLLSVSVGRGMLISVFQALLRAFLYVLIAAAIMVVLALVQIFSGTDVRGELPSLPQAGLVLSLAP
jgi:hypothetical protein